MLAPMSGVTNVAFRMLCKKQGAGICYTEFLSSDALIKYKDVHDNPIFDVTQNERPVVTQIFGEDVNKIYEAAKSIDGKINNALNEASNLLIDEREKLLRELSKLSSVAEGDKKLIKGSLDFIKKSLKI